MRIRWSIIMLERNFMSADFHNSISFECWKMFASLNSFHTQMSCCNSAKISRIPITPTPHIINLSRCQKSFHMILIISSLSTMSAMCWKMWESCDTKHCRQLVSLWNFNDEWSETSTRMLECCCWGNLYQKIYNVIFSTRWSTMKLFECCESKNQCSFGWVSDNKMPSRIEIISVHK